MTRVELLTIMVKAIVNNPDAVEIKETVDDRGVLLDIVCDPKDNGVVIGKQAVTIGALRRIMRLCGYKEDSVVSVRFEQGSQQQGGYTSSNFKEEKDPNDVLGDI